MGRMPADSFGDQLVKLRERIVKLTAGRPYELLSKKAKENLEEYRQDIKNLQKHLGEKELTYLEQLRKEVDEFCLLEDMRGWDKPEAKKSESVYLIPHGTKVTYDPYSYWGGLVYSPSTKYMGVITNISA